MYSINNISTIYIQKNKLDNMFNNILVYSITQGNKHGAKLLN